MSFFDTPGPRVFALPPGADFAARVAEGVRARLGGEPPEALARVEIIVNTARTARAMAAAFEQGRDAAYLPRITTIDRVAERAAAGLPPPVDRLERRLALTRLAGAMLAREPALGPPAAAGPLAETLARLLDEAHAARVPLSRLKEAVDDGRLAEHWRRSLAFLSVIRDHWPEWLAEHGALDPEARRAAATSALLDQWSAAPPPGPIIAAGSTGSTAVTAELLAATARLPQGAVILPGFDFALDAEAWSAATPEHPQYGFRELLARLDIAPEAVPAWTGDAAPGPRARLWAEALRPAPVTDGWLAALPRLTEEADDAAAGLTLIEAPSPRREAEAIALIMREALEREEGRVALATADRGLARRVAAALGRWGLEPDDSSGRPLALTPPSLFLSQVAGLLARRFDPVALLALLKHPLCGAPKAEVARLELDGLRDPDLAHRMTGVDQILGARASDDAPVAGDALARGLDRLRPWHAGERRPLGEWAAAHRVAAEALAKDDLWEKEAGQAVLAALSRLEARAPAYGDAAAEEYPALFSAALAEGGDVRAAAYRPHPRLAIWGPLEARAQSADVMILGGLNEGAWPAPPAPDPWLNRQMRARIGMPSPERRLGLSAHDFLQAASAPKAILTRALKADGAPTTPARWLSRLETLLKGAAPSALAAMRARGLEWLDIAAAIDRPASAIPLAPRPAPCPPFAARPRRLSVTEIETLIRDPYTIYARRILRLRALDEPGRPPDPRLRGQTLHAVVERFLAESDPWPGSEAARRLFDHLADEVIAETTPPPARAALWRARLDRVAPWFIEEEAKRRDLGAPLGAELSGETLIETAAGAFHLRGRADRIDRRGAGIAIYDYKAGAAPSEKQAKFYAKQLPLLGAMVEAGAFRGLPAATVEALAYISLRGDAKGGKETTITPDPEALTGLARLISRFDDPGQPYLPRAAPETITFASDYEHLSRFGEWSDRAPGDEL